MCLRGVGGARETTVLVHTECASLSWIGVGLLRPTSDKTWLRITFRSTDVTRRTTVTGIAILMNQVSGVTRTGACGEAL